MEVPGKQGYALSYDVWSNIHYGYIGSAAGFDEGTLQAAADLGAKVPPLKPFVGANDIGDKISIQIGIDLYARYKPEELTPQIIEQAVISAIPQYLTTGAKQLRVP